MLKLERVDNSRKISIRMRHKERFLNRIFLTALAAAAALHLLPLTLFTITPFRLGYVQRDLLPATVRADTGSNDALVNTSAHEADPSTKYLGLIPLPDSPLTKPRHTLIVKPEIPSTKDLLEDVSDDIPTLSSTHLPATYPRLSINVSGPLAEENILLDDKLKAAMVPRSVELDGLIQHKVVYNVRYEGEHGTLFWFDPLQLSSNKKINALAERLLTSLRFQNDRKNILLPGEIEMIFTLNGDEHENSVLTFY